MFTETARVGLRLVSGRGIQTVGPDSAEPLLTSEADAIALTRAEIERWHGADTGDPSTSLLHTAIVPRFTLSVTTQTLRALGELYAEVADTGVYVHTHLNENNRPGTGEIDSVKQLFEVDTYLDTYDGKFLPGSAHGGESLLGRRTILAHAVHCTDAELDRMAQTGTSIAHCPTSQLFLGSGTMPWRRTVGSGVTVAAGSDCGAGDEWLISRVLSDAFKVHISEPGDAGVSIHPAQLLFTGTLAARELSTRGSVRQPRRRQGGRLPGHRAVAMAAAGSGPCERDSGRRRDLAREQELFALLMALREPAIAEVYVRGQRVSPDEG